ncbi:hypothetical protein A3J41_01415, partial [candidate division TM6 bacterium RIFCSPHIGHO2_12_FULL_38_8]
MQKYGIVTIVKNAKFFTFSLIVCSIFFLSGCWSSSTSSPKLVVINVLDPDYYHDCHIAGSINIPFEQIDEQIKTLSKKDRYVLYCSNFACTAAPFAAQMMYNSGFEHVSFFPGGIVQWYQKGYPCTGPAQMAYLKEENEPLGDDDHPGV